jgi:hypothetical protein
VGQQIQSNKKKKLKKLLQDNFFRGAILNNFWYLRLQITSSEEQFPVI